LFEQDRPAASARIDDVAHPAMIAGSFTGRRSLPGLNLREVLREPYGLVCLPAGKPRKALMITLDKARR